MDALCKQKIPSQPVLPFTVMLGEETGDPLLSSFHVPASTWSGLSVDGAKTPKSPPRVSHRAFVPIQ